MQTPELPTWPPMPLCLSPSRCAACVGVHRRALCTAEAWCLAGALLLSSVSPATETDALVLRSHTLSELQAATIQTERSSLANFRWCGSCASLFLKCFKLHVHALHGPAGIGRDRRL